MIFHCFFLFSIGTKMLPYSATILEIIRFGFIEGFLDDVINPVILEIICSGAYQILI